jgi:type II secretory pathway pseudopilin PulG
VKPLARCLAAQGSSERGFVMIAVIITMMVSSLLVAAALSSAQQDARLTQNDLDQKQAYLAAKAGIAAYQFYLGQDPNYWTSCPAPTGSIPGNPNAIFTITPLPATGQAACSPINPVTSMIESSGPPNGTFRVRSSGFSNGVQRSIVATFQNRSFLDFLFYTVYETLSPSAYQSAPDRTAAATNCDVYWRNGRQPPNQNRNYCVQIFFSSNDVINGPLHTEDELAICGSPVFGRPGRNDAVEVVALAPGQSNQGNAGCPDSPVFNTSSGRLNTHAANIQPPPNNSQLKLIALPSYQWTGQTDIVLNGNTMTVTNRNLNGGQPTSMPWPSNGVVYASSSSCNTLYTPFGVTYTRFNATWAYSGSRNCGTITVHGTYSSSLTIAGDNDIVIDGSITRPNGNSALLGLIAQNFVRVYHPCSNGSNQAGTLFNPTITGAILSLAGSFIVDNYNCGSLLGTLNVTGAIAQIYRGPVGIIGQDGYVKNYSYDDNLRAEEPPHFLEPIQAAWHVVRETECNPGTTVC